VVLRRLFQVRFVTALALEGYDSNDRYREDIASCSPNGLRLSLNIRRIVYSYEEATMLRSAVIVVLGVSALISALPPRAQTLNLPR
jgi:hypothetical protein